jgi:CelD/BcsL family acetyltransferase involved in cellulose biosynthesis
MMDEPVAAVKISWTARAAALDGRFMGYESTTLRRADVVPELASAWDGLPAARGVQADVYDSHAWLSAWWDTTGAQAAQALRLPAVFDGDRPLGLLPLVVLSRGRWEFAGRGGGRMRYRPVIGSEQPDDEVLGMLADQVGRAGVRDLSLPRLPGRDPAVAALAAALRQAGFRVYRRERSSDCLAIVEGGWEQHRRRFAGYERSVKRFANRLRPLWDVTLDQYGSGGPVGTRGGSPVDPDSGPDGASLLDGYRVFCDVHDQSWKTPLTAAMREQAQALLRRAEPHGWARVYVLRVAGRPAAAHIWFRLGAVATWLETAYDQRLAAIGPGSILMWWSQERIFAESPPGVVDFIPGHNPQKDRLGPDRSPIVILEAARRTLVSGATFPVRRQARYVVPAVAFRVQRRLRGLRPAVPDRRVARARPVEVPPPDGGDQAPVVELELDASMRRFLAAVTGHHSPDAMAERWAPGDSWWRVGSRPLALVRLGTADGPARQVRELVLFEAGADAARSEQVDKVLAALASGLAAPVRAELASDDPAAAPATPIPVACALLPWPERDADPWRIRRPAPLGGGAR